MIGKELAVLMFYDATSQTIFNLKCVRTSIYWENILNK